MSEVEIGVDECLFASILIALLVSSIHISQSESYIYYINTKICLNYLYLCMCMFKKKTSFKYSLP